MQTLTFKFRLEASRPSCKKVRLLPQTDLFRGLPAFMQAGRLSFGVP